MLVFWSINCMTSFANVEGEMLLPNVRIHEAITFEAKIGNGKASIKVPAGTSVEVAGVEGEMLLLNRGEAKAKVHIDKTDYNEQLTKRRTRRGHNDDQNVSSNGKIKDAQNPYIRKEPIGDFSDTPQPNYNDPFVDIPIKDWSGYQFLFMPLYNFDIKQGYPAATKAAPWHLLDSFISYDKYIGRSFTVQKVNMEELNFGSLLIQMDDTKEKLYLPITTGNVKGVALKRDMDYARSNFIGKTLWLKNREAQSYDPETKKNKSELFAKPKKLTPSK